VHIAVKDTQQEELKKLSLLLYHISVQNESLKHENEGLREALYYKQKHKKKSKALDLQQYQEYHSRAVF
jgi:cell shape-determining protein MreC